MNKNKKFMTEYEKQLFEENKALRDIMKLIISKQAGKIRLINLETGDEIPNEVLEIAKQFNIEIV